MRKTIIVFISLLFLLISSLCGDIAFARGHGYAHSSAHTHQHQSSRAMRREAMRKEGIPTSQQPHSQSKNQSGREYSYKVPGSYGSTVTKSVQHQTMDRSHPNQPHWEAGKVKTDTNGNVRTNKYGRPKLDGNKSKVSSQ